jgi:hypothetical protein
MNKTIINFIVVNLIIFAGSLFIAYKYHNKVLKRTGKKQVTFVEFINNGKLPSFKNIMIGLIFGMVFGFLDNFGIWIGIEKLNNFLPGGQLTKAALGNTYSDMLGAIVGTSISIMAKDGLNYDDDDQPIWLNTIGIVLGCLLGLVAGRLVTGKV